MSKKAARKQTKKAASIPNAPAEPKPRTPEEEKALDAEILAGAVQEEADVSKIAAGLDSVATMIVERLIRNTGDEDAKSLLTYGGADDLAVSPHLWRALLHVHDAAWLVQNASNGAQEDVFNAKNSAEGKPQRRRYPTTEDKIDEIYRAVRLGK